MTDERTIGELTPVVTLLPAALIEIEQTTASFSATIQQVLDLGVVGISSINADTTAAQILAGTAGRISLVDAGATHTFDIDSAYVGQATITTLGTITTGVWNGTAITYANLSFSADIVNADISLTAAIVLTKLQDIATARLLGRQTAATGAIEEISLNATLELVATTTLQRAALTGDVTASAGSNTTTVANVPDGALSSNVVLINKANTFGDFNQTFKDNRILIESPDGLTPITIVNLQQTLARNLTIPILTGNRTIVVTTEASQIALGIEVTGASTDLSDSANLARNTDNLSFFAATTSLQLLGVISDETGSGALVFGTSPTIVTPTIASFVNATHNHQAASGGGTLLSTSALSDTADIAYLNTANTYTAGTRQDFLGLLAGTAGLNVGGIAGNPTTQVNGDIWLNTSTNTMFGRINGVNVDLGASGGEVFTWTNDHATGGNALTLTDDATPPVGTVAAIYLEAGELNLNVATGNLHQLRINDVVEYSFSAAALTMNNNNLIMGTGIIQFVDANQTITNSGGNLFYDVATGQVHLWRINNLTEMQLSATALDMQGNSVLQVGTLSLDDVNTSIQQSLSDLVIDVATGGAVVLRVNNVSEYDFDASRLDLIGKDIDNIQNLIHDLSTSGTDVDFTEDQLQEISIATDTTFTGVNYAIGKSKTIKITTDATLRTLTFPTGWTFVGTKPADQAASKEGILTLTCFTAAEAGVVAAYAVEA